MRIQLLYILASGFILMMAFVLALLSQFLALNFANSQVQDLQEKLYEQQIMFSKQQTQCTSYQLSQQLQTYPIMINAINSFCSKILAGIIQTNPLFKRPLLNTELFYQNKENKYLTEAFQKNFAQTSQWYQQNISQFNQLDIPSQNLLKNITLLDPLIHSIYYHFSQLNQNSSVTLQRIMFGFENDGILFLTTKNYSFSNVPNTYNCNKGLFNFDPRCSEWFIKSQNYDSQILFSPNYANAKGQFSNLLCQKMNQFNQQAGKDIIHHVQCFNLLIQNLVNYFQNFAKSTIQSYILDPRTNQVIYDSSQPYDYPQQTIQEIELQKLQSQYDAQVFENMLSKYNYWILESQNYSSNELLAKLTEQVTVFEYQRNKTNSNVILSPIFIIDKKPQFLNVKQEQKSGINIEIAFVQINIISDTVLKQQSENMIQFFDKFYFYSYIAQIILAVIVIFFQIYYTIKILYLLNSPIVHLINILKKIQIDIKTDQLFSLFLDFSLNLEDIFLSKEAYNLFKSFECVFHTLTNTSCNFFIHDQNQTLMSLCKKVQFFEQFQNYNIVGIAHNNIGSILVSQGHYFQALEHFSQSILFAQYEIQGFCNSNKQSLSSQILAQFGFDCNQKKNKKINQKQIQSDKNNPLSSMHSYNLSSIYSKTNALITKRQKLSMDYFKAEKNKTKVHLSDKNETNDQNFSQICNNLEECQFQNILHEINQESIYEKLKNEFFKKKNISQNEIEDFMKNNNRQNYQSQKEGFISQKHRISFKNEYNDQSYKKIFQECCYFIDDGHLQQRIQLLLNIYFRKRNYITTLIAFQESQDEDKKYQKQHLDSQKYNFWQEIKSLLKNILCILPYLPFEKQHEIEILTLICKCHVKLNNIQKCEVILMYCECLKQSFKKDNKTLIDCEDNFVFKNRKTVYQKRQNQCNQSKNNLDLASALNDQSNILSKSKLYQNPVYEIKQQDFAQAIIQQNKTQNNNCFCKNTQSVSAHSQIFDHSQTIVSSTQRLNNYLKNKNEGEIININQNEINKYQLNPNTDNYKKNIFSHKCQSDLPKKSNKSQNIFMQQKMEASSFIQKQNQNQFLIGVNDSQKQAHQFNNSKEPDLFNYSELKNSDQAQNLNNNNNNNNNPFSIQQNDSTQKTYKSQLVPNSSHQILRQKNQTAFNYSFDKQGYSNNLYCDSLQESQEQQFHSNQSNQLEKQRLSQSCYLKYNQVKQLLNIIQEKDQKFQNLKKSLTNILEKSKAISDCKKIQTNNLPDKQSVLNCGQTKQNIEMILKNIRKIEQRGEEQDDFIFELDGDVLNFLIDIAKVELLSKQKKYYQAANILTSLFENSKKFMSHFPQKIIKLLKNIFENSGIISKDFNNICKKFNPQIQMQVAIIFACQNDNNSIYQSISLLSNIVNQTLTQQRDQLGIIISSFQHSFIQLYQCLTFTCMIKPIFKNVIEDVYEQISYKDFQNLLQCVTLCKISEMNLENSQRSSLGFQNLENQKQSEYFIDNSNRLQEDKLNQNNQQKKDFTFDKIITLKSFYSLPNDSPISQKTYQESYILAEEKSDFIQIPLDTNPFRNILNQYQQNATEINQLDQHAQQILFQINRIDPLMKAVLLQSEIQGQDKYIPIQNIFFGFSQEGLFYSTSLNSTLSIEENSNCSKGTYGIYNPICRKWYQDAIKQTSLSLNSPIISYGDQLPFSSQQACQKVAQFNESTNKMDISHVLCIESKISNIKDYFQNLAQSTKQLFIIQPSSQLVIFDSSQPDYSSFLNFQTIQEIEFDNLDPQSSDIQQLQQTLNSNYSQWILQSYDYIDNKILNALGNLTVSIPYTRNGTKYQAIIDPILIFDQIPYYSSNFEQKGKTLVEVAYLQINIISDQELQKYQQSIIFILNNFFVYGGVLVLIFAIISIFISIFYTVQILNIINAPINHLLKILKRIQINSNDSELGSIISSNLLNEKEMFLSRETYELYMSFSSIFNLLLLQSENIYKDNQAKTLLTLCKNVDFLQNFQNYYAVGITYNNIGVFLLNQCQFFHALESFQSSIQFAKYEIQKFCNQNPSLAKSSGLYKYCFNFQINDNDSNQASSVKNIQTQSEQTPINNQQRKQTEYEKCKSNSIFKKADQLTSDQTKIQVNSQKNGVSNFSQAPIEQQNYVNQDAQLNLKIWKTIKMKIQQIFKCKKNIQSEIKQEEIQNKDEQKDENDQQQIVQLYSNYFYRKQNYVFTLIAYQESFDLSKQQKKSKYQTPQLNLWHEIKDLIKELKIISSNLPVKIFIEPPLNYLTAKCYFRLNQFEKALKKFNICYNLIDQLKNNQMANQQHPSKIKNNSIVKRETKTEQNVSLNKVKNYQLKKQQSFSQNKLSLSKQNEGLSKINQSNTISGNNYQSLQDYQTKKKYSNFQKQNTIKNQESSPVKLDQNEQTPLTQHSNISYQKDYFIDYSSICKVVIREPNPAQQESIIESSSPLLTQRKLHLFQNSCSPINSNQVVNSQFLQRLKSIKNNTQHRQNQQIVESLALIENNENKQRNISFKANKEINNQTFSDAFSKLKGQDSEQPNKSNLNLETYFVQKSKEYQENLEKKNNQIQLFVQTIQMALGFYQAEFYLQKKDYLQAANYFSQIFEQNQRILAHFPFRIASYLKDIFNLYDTLSPLLDQMLTRLQQNQPMHLAIILDTNGNNKTAIESLKIISGVSNDVLYKNQDQLAISIFNQEDGVFERYMEFVKVTQIKTLINAVLSDINGIISKFQSQDIIYMASEILEKENDEDNQTIFNNSTAQIQQQQQQQQQNINQNSRQDLKFQACFYEKSQNITGVFQNQSIFDDQQSCSNNQLLLFKENQKQNILDESYVSINQQDSQNNQSNINDQNQLKLKQTTLQNLLSENHQSFCQNISQTKIQSSFKSNFLKRLQQYDSKISIQNPYEPIRNYKKYLSDVQNVKLDYAQGDVIDQLDLNSSQDQFSDSNIQLQELPLNQDTSFQCKSLKIIDEITLQEHQVQNFQKQLQTSVPQTKAIQQIRK
ncbi:hypothetical protein ABPG74_020465 [Tetrahymena malaccensis]